METVPAGFPFGPESQIDAPRKARRVLARSRNGVSQVSDSHAQQNFLFVLGNRHDREPSRAGQRTNEG